MSLTIVQRSGADLFTTSEAIADGAGVAHDSVKRLIRDSTSDLEEFGLVGFEIRANSTVRGEREEKVWKLNEQQATLILTYLRNTEQVRAFKKALVKAFYEMAQALNRPRSLEERSLEILGELTTLVDQQRAELEAVAPKVQAYDTFIDADGKYSVGTVAKMLGLSQNKLFTELRNHGVFIAKGHMHNTPYQQYMHHFTVKATTIHHNSGTESVRYTTYVQPSGVDFIKRKLALTAVA